MAGTVECHMAYSWLHLRALRTEALNYGGLGREVVRNSVLLGLGAFALILSLLPNGLVRDARWVMGFEVDWTVGLGMLLTCQGEGGVYAPISALGWLSFTIDTKAFLGEEQTETSWTSARSCHGGEGRGFPNLLFFGIIEADLCAIRRDLPAELGVLDGVMALPPLDELRALEAMLSNKKAVYHLAGLEWLEAGRAFRKAQAVYKAAG